METFAERLKEQRLKNKMTLVQLGEALGVNYVTISRWENSVMLPVINHLYEIAVFFGVSADYLLGLTDIMSVR